MKEFLTSNSAGARLARTIVQAIIGVLIANMDLLVGQFIFNAEIRPVIVGLVMAILSPIMAALGDKNGGGVTNGSNSESDHRKG